MQVPEMNYLMELDPTHMVFPYQNDIDPAYHHVGICVEDDELQWPVYEEAKGG